MKQFSSCVCGGCMYEHDTSNTSTQPVDSCHVWYDRLMSSSLRHIEGKKSTIENKKKKTTKLKEGMNIHAIHSYDNVDIIFICVYDTLTALRNQNGTNNCYCSVALEMCTNMVVMIITITINHDIQEYIYYSESLERYEVTMRAKIAIQAPRHTWTAWSLLSISGSIAWNMEYIHNYAFIHNKHKTFFGTHMCVFFIFHFQRITEIEHTSTCISCVI